METGDRVLIGGFVIGGTAPKRVLVRGLGPSLSAAGVPNTLQDPVIRLFSANGQIATNDDWEDTDANAIAATGLRPSNALESAVITTLAPGGYTVIQSGLQNGEGIGLVEVYDLDGASASALVNISTRGMVRADDNVMIGGIVVGGASTGQFVVRAVGPSLAGAGVPNPLPNPVLQLHDINGNMISFNDNWRDSQAADLQTLGLAPASDLESAIVRTLPPGNYTAIVRSLTPTSTGVALVEIYHK